MHLLHVVPTQKRASHGSRLTWLNWYTRRDGNRSPDWYPAMKRLESLRPAARYSDSVSLPDDEELGALLDQVVQLVDYAAAHGGVDEAEQQPPSGEAG